jgi:hypothetical protein
VFEWEQEVVQKRWGKEFLLAVMLQWKNPERILLQRLLEKWRFIFAFRKERFSLMSVVKQGEGLGLANLQFKSSLY